MVLEGQSWMKGIVRGRFDEIFEDELFLNTQMCKTKRNLVTSFG